MRLEFPQRKLENWLQSYIKYTEPQEAPEIFHTFTGLTVLSCALCRNVFMDMGYFTIYPNLYLLLLAGSASARKTVALSIGRNLLRDAFPEFPIFAQRGSAEALIKRMKEIAEKTGQGTILIYNDEFGTFMGSDKKTRDDLISMLTTLYDCGTMWEYETISRGLESIPNVWCALMAGITPDAMKDAIPPTAVGGGFTSRMLLIFQEKSTKRNYRPLLSSEQHRLKDFLIGDLQLIGSYRGEIKLTNEADDWYRQWYEEIYNPDKSIPGMSGYFGRKHVLLLKIAMLICVSRSINLVVDEIDMQAALAFLNDHEKFLPILMGTLVSEGAGTYTIQILRYIEKKGEVSHSELVRSMSYKMDAKTLMDSVETLLVGGQIFEKVDTSGKGRPSRSYVINRRL